MSEYKAIKKRAAIVFAVLFFIILCIDFIIY